MPTFVSEGQAAAMAHFKPPTDPPSLGLREQLKTLIEDKEKQLVLIGTLGQRFLSQQVELEERIQQMDEVENAASGSSEIDSNADLRSRLEELAQLMQSWETENQQMWNSALTLGSRTPNGDGAGANISFGNESTSFNSSFPEDTSLPVEAGPSAAQSSRRARNAGLQRTNNVEFATEIGNHLTREIRRMQALLSERDKALQDMKEEKDDLERSLESLRSALRERETSAEKFKDENWNLEFQIQELRVNLAEATAARDRAEADQKRTFKQLTTARESIDTYKNESERLQTSLDDLRGKHETDVAHMRKVTAGLQRDKSDLQTTLDTLKTDITKKSRIFPHLSSPATPTDDFGTPGDDDVFTGNNSRRQYDTSAMLSPSDTHGFDSSPDASPSKPSVVVTPSHPSNEIEALKQSLAHAHRQMSTLKSSIQREKELKMEYRRKLAQEGMASMDWDDDEGISEGSPQARSRTGVPLRGGRGRGGRSRGNNKLTLAQKLGMAAAERALGSPESPYRPRDDQGEPELLLDEEELSPFIEPQPSRPTSIEGMDPAFANVLRSLPSNETINPSIDTSPAARSRTLPRRPRGRVPFRPEGRPTSLVNTAPTSLGAELGQNGDIEAFNTTPVDDDDNTFEDPLLAYRRDVETVEVGIQSEPEPVPPLPIPAPVISTVEASVQSEPEPLPPRIITRETSTQSDTEVLPIPAPPPPQPVRAHAATQSDPEPAPPAVQVEESKVELRDAGIQWEPKPRLLSVMFAQTDEPPVTTVSDIAVSTDDEPTRFNASAFTDPIVSVEAHTQTSSIPLIDAVIQTIAKVTAEIQTQTDQPVEPPAPVVPVIIEPSSHSQPIPLTISTSSAVAMPRTSMYGRSPVARPVAMLFDEESEVETETDAEYVDARETEPTPFSSVQDFQSFENTDQTDSDAESIRTSTGNVFRTSPHAGRISRSRYDSQATTRVPVLTVKPEVKEMSVQTEEWKPPTPRPSLLPSSPNTINFHRVGSAQSAQFQYIPSSPIKPTPPSLVAAANVVRSPVRDSTGTFGSINRIRTPSVISAGERRPSMDSYLSRNEEVPPSPVGGSHLVLPPVDKTRPPTMSLPPPPSMPPPSTIPVKKSSVPPPRPTSPPPPELVQRATTPTFGRQSSLMVPQTRASRQIGGSVPPSQTALRQPPSTSSFRSTAAPGVRTITRSGPPPSTFINPVGDRRDMSQTSLLSGSSAPSRRPSMNSSHSSGGKDAPATPPTANAINSSTDPAVIHAITQTMIGEYLYKYTRKVVGKGHGEKRHKRFFWVHPYTKTLYWSSADPGASNSGESNAKSAYIDAVKSVIDPNPMPPGLHQYSIIVYTPQREMKFTAPTKERHDIWFKALSYLLDRPSAVPVTSPAGGSMPPSPMPSRLLRPGTPGEDGVLRGAMLASPSSVRSAMSNGSVDSWNLTPRARAQTHLSPPSTGRRAGTPAAEYLRTYSDAHLRGYPDLQSPTKSIKSLQQRFEDALDDRDDDGFETVDHHLPNLPSGDFEINTDEGEGFEGLENVRACCDGEHDLNHLSNGPGHHHHHHHHHHHPPNQASIRPSSRMSSRPDPPAPSSRPVSPSAWSFRSRSGSQPSDGASLFSWGGGGDGKRSIRFGSRRSAKSSTPAA